MIENYKMYESIGQGEYGKVYRATNLLTNNVVAIKIVDMVKFNETPKLLELSMQEIEVLQKLQDSPHIVRFIELIKAPHCYYFVYEYCSGGPLDKLLMLQGHFTEQKSLKIFYQLLQAFKSLREHSIIHRDLKPGNILIHNGVFKLGDFGFCKSIKNDVTATMLGSPIYMAPEVLRGLTYNNKADIWSLGAVLYELLIGRCPFEEKSIAKLITAQDEQDWNIPAPFRFVKQTMNLLKSMLIKDPLKRCTWEYLFNIPMNEEGEFTGDLDVYSDNYTHHRTSQSLNKMPTTTVLPRVNILQEIVNERCKVQFLCQSANSILEMALNDKAPIVAYLIMQMAQSRGQQFMNVIRNYMNIAESKDYPSLNKLQQCLKTEHEIKSLTNNFEYTRLSDTIQREIDTLITGVQEYKQIIETMKLDNREQTLVNCRDLNTESIKQLQNAVHQYVNSIRSQHYLAFIDHKQDRDRHIVVHSVQVLDALYVDKFMVGNIDPTLDNYLEVRAMTKKQLNGRFDALQII